MNILIIQICSTVFFRTSSYVSIPVEIRLDNAIDTCYKWKTSDVEFSALIQKRIINVFLKNHRPISWAVWVYKSSNFLKLLLNFYSITTIWIFSGFYNPNIFSIFSLAALTDLLFPIVVFLKSSVFRIIRAVLDMKG